MKKHFSDSLGKKKIVLVAGETSGDQLGAELIESLKKHCPQIECIGIGGEKMKAAGLSAWFDLSALSVMGIWNVLLELPRLWRLYRSLLKQIKAFDPDIFIGIDAPDFNLRLEKDLSEWSASEAKKLQIFHYVSPSVWAWRYDRIFQMKSHTQGVFCLLPFEPKWYEKIGHPAYFVGHPLARKIPMGWSKGQTTEAKIHLNLSEKTPLVGILPGSRLQEVSRLLPVFLKAFEGFKQKVPEAMAVIPVAEPKLWKAIKPYEPQMKQYGVFAIEGRADAVLGASDVVLVTSGTAVLESVLYQKPTVAAYQTDGLSYLIGKTFVDVPYITLPNLWAYWEKGISNFIPEFIQSEATPEALSEALWNQWENLKNETESYETLMSHFEALHREMAFEGTTEILKAMGISC